MTCRKLLRHDRMIRSNKPWREADGCGQCGKCARSDCDVAGIGNVTCPEIIPRRTARQSSTLLVSSLGVQLPGATRPTVTRHRPRAPPEGSQPTTAPACRRAACPLASMAQVRALVRENVPEKLFAGEEPEVRIVDPALAHPLIGQPMCLSNNSPIMKRVSIPGLGRSLRRCSRAWKRSLDPVVFASSAASCPRYGGAFRRRRSNRAQGCTEFLQWSKP
ncbi:hypothetical protein ACVWXN_005941 [Bradyrhizobium sp. i1.4.4]